MRYATIILSSILIVMVNSAISQSPLYQNSNWEVYVSLDSYTDYSGEVTAANAGSAMWGASKMLTDSISGAYFDLVKPIYCSGWPSACQCWPNGYDFITSIDSYHPNSGNSERYLPYGLMKIAFSDNQDDLYSIYLDLRDDRIGGQSGGYDVYIMFSFAQGSFKFTTDLINESRWDTYSPGSTIDIWEYIDGQQHTSSFQPTTPTNLTVSWNDDYTHPLLQWNSSEPSSACYNIYRRTGNGSYQQIASNYGSTSYLDTQVGCGLQTYYYKVIAVSGDGSKQSPSYIEKSFSATCVAPIKDIGTTTLGNVESLSGTDTSIVVFWPNSIRAYLWSIGVYFAPFNPPQGIYTGGLLWPGYTLRGLVNSSGPWIAGKDEAGVARAATSCYTTIFQPGAIVHAFSDSNYTAAAGDPSDSSYFISLLSDTSTAASSDYQRWTRNASLTGAPLNQDGTPKLYGDLNAYWVMNDLDSTAMLSIHHYQPSMGVEVHNYVFAFDSSSTEPLNRTIFINLEYINKSLHTYDSCYVGWFDDIDLGNPNDDLDGCDTLLSLGYMYNGLDSDQIYGFPPPACGFVILRGPGISNSGQYMTAFFKDQEGNTGNGWQLPYNAPADKFSQVTSWELSGKDFNGNLIYPPSDPSHIINYAVPGDPVTGTGWVETLPNDRRNLIGSGPFTFHPGDTVRFSLAFVVGLGTDRLNSVNVLKSYIPAVRQKWESVTAVESGREPPSIPSRYDMSEGYPNPFNPSTNFRVTLPTRANVEVIVYDILGREIRTLKKGDYAAGIYSVTWDGRNDAGMTVSSGVYFCVMKVSSLNGKDIRLMRKVALLK